MQWLSVIAAAVMAIEVSQAARILILAPFSTPSHRIFFMSIAEALAAKNHSVTLVTKLNPMTPKPNIREILIPAAEMNSHADNLFTSSKASYVFTYFMHWPKDCVDALATKEMEQLKEEEFDLVILSIVMSECFYSVIHKLQVPFIHANPQGLMGFYNDMANNPQFLSLEPSVLMDLEVPLTFSDRMINTLSDTTIRAMYFYFLHILERKCRERRLCSEDMPSPSEMMSNGSLMIVNSVRTMEMPVKPSVPTVVHVGGIHCRPARPLPQELEEWVAGAGEAGFIYFSLGSAVKTKDMPETYRKVLLQVLASLQQRVLWKWDQGTMEDLPPNVRLGKWLPQQDILGHPSLRLFITHGGLLSTQEATYHGVPLLGLPVYLDQHYNMGQVQQQGWGRVLQWEDISYDTLRNHILHLISNTKMREEVARRSVIMKDQAVPPGEWTVYWVEYVLRHNGANHLRCPAINMTWYELYNVDVWLVLVIVLVVVMALTLKVLLLLICCLYSLLCSTRKHKQH